MKRFYDAAGIQQTKSGWQVTLDGRGLKTVKGADQIVPTESLARLLFAEWDVQGETLDPGEFALRDMADYAIDVVASGKTAVCDNLIAYGETDTLLYRADPEDALFARQNEVWEPIVSAFEKRDDIALVRVSGIVHKPQDKSAMASVKARLKQLDEFALAGTEAMGSLAASLIIALSALESESGDDAAELWAAANLEEDWQADLWGRDSEADARRNKRRSDFLKAWEFARAARS